MRWLDLPPFWLVLFLFMTWVIAQALPQIALTFEWQRPVAYGFFVLGVGLMVLAAYQMYKSRTTIVPHRQPDALVKDGVFRFSRNPIYLGDMIVLVGAILYWGAIIALPLVWIFKRVIEKRFIEIEEGKLRVSFPDEFEKWSSTTRRWL